MSSRGQFLQRAASHQADFGERWLLMRIPGIGERRKRAFAEKIRVGAARERRRWNKSPPSPVFGGKGGGGVEKVSGGAWLITPPKAQPNTAFA